MRDLTNGSKTYMVVSSDGIQRKEFPTAKGIPEVGIPIRSCFFAKFICCSLSYEETSFMFVPDFGDMTSRVRASKSIHGMRVNWAV